MSAGGMGGQVQQPMGGGGKGGMGMNRGPGGNAQNNPGGQGGPRPFGPGPFNPFSQQGPGSPINFAGNPGVMSNDCGYGTGGNPVGNEQSMLRPSWASTSGMTPIQGLSNYGGGGGNPNNGMGRPDGFGGGGNMTPIQGLSNYGQPQSFPGFSGGAAGPTPRQQKPMPMGGLLSQLYGNFGG